MKLEESCVQDIKLAQTWCLHVAIASVQCLYYNLSSNHSTVKIGTIWTWNGSIQSSRGIGCIAINNSISKCKLELTLSWKASKNNQRQVFWDQIKLTCVDYRLLYELRLEHEVLNLLEALDHSNFMRNERNQSLMQNHNFSLENGYVQMSSPWKI